MKRFLLWRVNPCYEDANPGSLVLWTVITGTSIEDRHSLETRKMTSERKSTENEKAERKTAFDEPIILWKRREDPKCIRNVRKL